MIESKPSRPSRVTKRELREIRHKIRLQNELAIGRRRLFKTVALLTGSAIGTAVFGAGVWHIITRPSPDPRPSPKNKIPENPPTAAEVAEQHRDKEGILARVIFEADSGIDLLERQLTSRLATTDPLLRTALAEPLEVYRINKSNPDRNVYTLLLADLAERGEAAIRSPKAFAIPDLNFFYMGLLSGNVEVIGSFSPPSRTLLLRENLNGQNLYGALTVYHESDHARQDAVIRSKLTTPEISQRYNDFFNRNTGVSNILIELEYQSYARHIEALNLLSDQRLKTDVLGAKQVDVEWYRQRLNARLDQLAAIDDFIQVSRVYYISGSSVNAYAVGFQRYIDRAYSEKRLYRLTDIDTFQVRPLP